jgi:predicted nucleotidyltransferase
MSRSYEGTIISLVNGLREVAATINVDERTLRRAASRGAIKCRRPSEHRVVVPDDEREYLESHWPLLSDLQSTLRTEPSVRLAVLYGSSARGDDTEESDVDVMVVLRDEKPGDTVRLASRLRRTLGAHVDVASLSRVERQSPLLLLQVLNEGRVIADRDTMWSDLKSRRDAIRQRAKRARRKQRERTAAALSGWLGDS